MSYWSTLSTAILPVLSIAVVGYALGRFRDVDVDPLATVTIYVLAPALVFYSVATTDLGASALAGIFVGVGAFTLAMAGVAEAYGRLVGEREPTLSALVLTSAFSNCGNFGIPLSAFAFGATGRSVAVVYLVSQNVFMYTLGVYLASRGNRDVDLRASMQTVFELPLLYALVAAIAVRELGVLPATDTTVMQTIQLTGDAAIPVMLLLLGIQLARADHSTAFRQVAPANAMRLLVAPVLALVVALAVGFGDTTVARVFVLESAAPAAITPLMLSIELQGSADADVSGPEYISTAILTTTLLSAVTLTAVITMLRSGAVL